MKLAKERDVDPGGSLTRLATELYVDTHSATTFVEAVDGDPHILAHYRLNEVSGPIIDSVGSIDGTLTGGVQGSPGILRGDLDTALALASGDYVDFGDNFAFTGVTPFSVEMLFKPSVAVSGNRPLCGRHDGSSTGWMLLLDGTYIYFFRGGATFAALPAAPWNPLVPPRLAHIMATYDGAYRRLYVDGHKVAEGADSAALGAAAVHMHLGTLPVYGSCAIGTYDEFALYNDALSDDVVFDHAMLALS